MAGAAADSTGGGSGLCKVAKKQLRLSQSKEEAAVTEPTASFKAHETWVCQLARDNLPAKPLQLTVKQNINSKLKWLQLLLLFSSFFLALLQFFSS